MACPRHGIVSSHERYLALIDHYFRSKNYDYLEIRDKTTGGVTLTELLNTYREDNTYFSLPGDILIIHSGIVDCAPRPISDSLRLRVSKLPSFLKKIVIKYIHNNRKKLILKGKVFVKTEKEKFQIKLDTFLKEGEENYKKIFVINICPTTAEIDSHSPGLSDSITLYNTLISNSINKIKSPKIELIDIHNEITQRKENILNYIVKEDGHHIRPATHKIIAEKILEKCKEL